MTMFARIAVLCAALLSMSFTAAAYYQTPETSRVVMRAPATDTAEQTAQRIAQATSRTVLTTAIRNLGLYRDELRRQPVEDVIEEMRRFIVIERAANNQVTVEFRGANAKAVVDYLTRYFVEAGFTPAAQ